MMPGGVVIEHPAYGAPPHPHQGGASRGATIPFPLDSPLKGSPKALPRRKERHCRCRSSGPSSQAA